MLKFKKKKRIEFVLPLRLCGENYFASFTLVELMLVMGIIAILAAMVYPVIIGAKEKARKKQALTEAHNIVLALKGYRAEYDKWPNQVQAAQDKTYFTNNYLVALPLMGQNFNGQNARGKVFLTVQATNQTDSVTNLVDPWGVPYVICLDENMNISCVITCSNVKYVNSFANPAETKYYSATNYPVTNVEVAVASFAGETNAFLTAKPFAVETWSDPQ